MKIQENREYFGEMIHNWTDDYQNKYVITGLQQGNPGIDRQIGRVAQIRQEAGDFGSDNVLLRHCDNVLMQHTNQCFYLIPEKFNSYLDKCFKNVDLDDSNKRTYTLGEGKFPEKGFIIKSKIKEGESTPMRDIRGAIYNKLSEL